MTEQSSGRPKLGRDVYMALAAIGWADGKLDQNEADALVRTALEEGLELEEIEKLEAATKTRIELESLDLKDLPPDSRRFVYAVGCWMARLDGDVSGSEVAQLRRIADVLDLTPQDCQAAARASADAGQATGDRVDQFDLLGLYAQLVGIGSQLDG